MHRILDILKPFGSARGGATASGEAAHSSHA